MRRREDLKNDPLNTDTPIGIHCLPNSPVPGSAHDAISLYAFDAAGITCPPNNPVPDSADDASSTHTCGKLSYERK